MTDEYRVVGPNHHHDGERVERGTVLSAEEIPDGLLRHFPSKFEPVGEADASTAEVSATSADADNGMDGIESADTEDPSDEPGETPEAAETVVAEEPDPDEPETAGGYTRAELTDMTRSERVQLAKESDNPDIDGRSSDDDILAALATDADADEE